MKRLTTPRFSWGGYKLSEKIGSGGNGDVWRGTSSKKPDIAVKFLRAMDRKKYERFKSEVRVVAGLSGFQGIVPIIASELPENPSSQSPAWYAMPLGDPVDVRKLHKQPTRAVEGVAAVADTLARLHQLDISHRDIKPANIILINGNWCISDFGLAKWPHSMDITADHESVGPKWTMAPEMRRIASKSDGAAADIYSLAKSLWILLTQQSKGFDGQYGRHLPISLGAFTFLEYVRPIERLLEDSTQYDPKLRPTAQQFNTRLTEWIAARKDFHARCLSEWAHMQYWLFPRWNPHRAVWTDVEAIAEILKEVVSTRSLNHSFLPTGGGQDLEGCTNTAGGLLNLECGATYQVKPLLLEVVIWSHYPEWSYFWLELGPLEPSGLYDIGQETFQREEVVELPNGRLLDRYCWDENAYYDEYGVLTELPDESRLLVRFSGGAIVMFAKRSPYNLDGTTYDARHSELGRTRFYDYVSAHIDWKQDGEMGVPDVPRNGPLPIGFRRAHRK